MGAKAKTKTETKAKSRSAPAQMPVPIPEGSSVLLSSRQVGGYLGFADRTIRKKRAAGEFPEPDLFVFGEARWKSETIVRWVAEQPKENTSARRVPEKAS